MSHHQEEHQAKFISYWEGKRRNKGKIYLQHFFLWGIFASTMAYLLTLRFKLDDFEWTQYLLRIVFWSLGSQLYALLKIRTQEKQYQKLIEHQDSNMSIPKK